MELSSTESSKENRWPVFASRTNGRRKLHNYKLQMLFQRPGIIKDH